MAQPSNKKSSNATKKTSASSNKKAPAKSQAKKKSSKSKQLTMSEIIFKKEFSSTVTFIAGLILLIVALFSGAAGSAWNRIHSIYFALFGICAYYIPLAVLFFGVVCVLNKQTRKHFIKGAELFFMFIILCSFFHVNNFADASVGFTDAVKTVFSQSFEDPLSALTNGGVAGAVFGGAIFQLSKSVLVSDIILILLFIGDIMLLFAISLRRIFVKMEKPAHKVGEFTEDVLEKSRQELERQKKERAEAKTQEKSKTKDVDPARIVNDFFGSNEDSDIDETEQENLIFDGFAKSKKRKEDEKPPENIKTFVPENERKREIKAEREESEQSIFSVADFIKKQDEPSDSVSEPIAEAEVPAAREIEKLEPLSEKETQALMDSLDDAVMQVQEKEYVLPPLDCLNRPKSGASDYSESELQANGEKLIAALGSFNVSASICGVVPGPTVTRYELSPAPGVKISKFVGLADDLALHMAAPAGLRIEAPIPNKAAIGIEIPNRNKTTVTFREIIDTDKFRDAPSKLTVALGKDISGTPIYSNLAKMPHLLVAGTTGSGKSVCLNSMIVSLLYNASPDEVKILLIDPKQVEFGVYNGLPHLLVPVVSDPRKASGALGWAVTEMLSRYKTLNANGVRDIGAYNSLCEERDDLTKMSHIVIFIDELADLMTVAPAEVEDAIQRLAQMARAAGMHLVVATQRPSVDVITGVIKANIPSRIALTVKSQVDSRTIIDSAGAEKLMGNGDMLYYPVGIPKPVRVQGCYLSDSEIENVVSFIKANSSSNYDDAVQQEIDKQAASEKKKASEENASAGVDANDELLMRAIELFVGTPEKASISALQRHLGLGFAKAGRLMDTLEQKGIVGPHMGSKPRNVLITKAQWYEMNAVSSDSAVAVSPEEAVETAAAEKVYDTSENQ